MRSKTQPTLQVCCVLCAPHRRSSRSSSFGAMFLSILRAWSADDRVANPARTDLWLSSTLMRCAGSSSRRPAAASAAAFAAVPDARVPGPALPGGDPGHHAQAPVLEAGGASAWVWQSCTRRRLRLRPHVLCSLRGQVGCRHSIMDGPSSRQGCSAKCLLDSSYCVCGIEPPCW